MAAITALELALKAAIDGQVHFDRVTKLAYSVDASIYEVEPLGVVIPQTKKDLFTALSIAKDYGVAVIARGAATGITGGCLGTGLVVDLSKYFNKIIQVDYDKEFVICEPGVIQDELNSHLAANGFRLGPDTSTGNRATIGGMLANNAAGARSLRYGKMVDHVQAVKLVLASGEVVDLCFLSEEEVNEKKAKESQEGDIYREIDRIRKEYAEEIDKRFVKIPRRVSGYNLDELIKPGPLNLSKLIAGSEGSLGIALEVKLKICKIPKKTALCVIHFHEMIPAMHRISDMLAFAPLSLEMIDDKIIETGRSHPSMQGKLDWLLRNPQAVFVAEFEGETVEIVKDLIFTFETEMRNKNIGYAYSLLFDPLKMNDVWELRKAGLGLLLSKRTYSRAIAFIEDISVPPDHLADFMGKFLSYLKSVGKQAGIYGHVGSGCMHIRPYIDLRKSEELRLMETIMQEVANLLLEYGGALSGEHGDGYVRSWLNKKMFGDKLYQAFCEVKSVFDPDNRMNPGKVVATQPLIHDLRLSPSSKPVKMATFLNFDREGGFELAVDLCNGNGMCRKSEKLMCPSFQVSRDEYDTTRARAQALRGIVNGKWPMENFTSHELYAVLDLCLECKGCKTECPSEVDMAKMKSEFLYQYQEKHGYPLRNYLFGYVGTLNRLAFPFARLFNAMGSTSFVKKGLSLIGISEKRELPALAQERFSSWFQKQEQEKHLKKTVVLFNDTFTEFNHPEIGQAAFKVLSQLGYEIVVPSWNCCGRPLLSKGMLKAARRKALKLISALYPFAKEGYPIIGLEPSCILTLKNDLADLLQESDVEAKEMMNCIAPLCQTFDHFIHQQLVEGKLPLNFCETAKKVIYHGHCHQKSFEGVKETLEVLRALPGCEASEIPSGCCGMAGSFGYESEHYDFSMQIGKLKLFPAIEKTPQDTVIVAGGTSCRSQIAHGTNRRSLHLAEVIAEGLLTG